MYNTCMCTCVLFLNIHISYNCKLMHLKCICSVRRLKYIQHYSESPENKNIMNATVQFLNFWCHFVYMYCLHTLVIFKSTNAFSRQLVSMACHLSLFYSSVSLFLKIKIAAVWPLMLEQLWLHESDPRTLCLVVRFLVPHKV